MTLRLLRPWTATQQRIADGIMRELSYVEIGEELAAFNGRRKPVSGETIRSQVRMMAQLIDGLEELGYELPPRHQVRAYVGILASEQRRRRGAGDITVR